MSKSSRRRSSPTWSASFSVCAAGKYVTTPNEIYTQMCKNIPRRNIYKIKFQYVLCGRGRMRSRQWELKLFFRCLDFSSLHSFFSLLWLPPSLDGNSCVCDLGKLSFPLFHMLFLFFARKTALKVTREKRDEETSTADEFPVFPTANIYIPPLSLLYTR